MWAENLDGYSPERESGRFLLLTLIVENIGKSSRLFGIAGEYFGATGSAEIVVIDSEGFEDLNIPLSIMFLCQIRR